MNQLLTKYKFLYPILVVVLLITNLLYCWPLIMDNQLPDLFHKYGHFTIPIVNTFKAGFAIMVWTIIIIVLNEIRNEKTVYHVEYQNKIRAVLAEWICYQIILTLSWKHGVILLSLIMVAASANLMIKMIKIISKNRVLRSSEWLLKFPIGMHAGWLIYLTMINLFSYIKSIGMNETENVFKWATMVAMLLLLVLVIYLFVMYGNPGVMVSLIMSYVGIALNHQTKMFQYSNETIRAFTWILITIGGMMFIYLSVLQFKQQKENI